MMNELVIVEWEYSPKDYFEAPYNINIKEYKVTIEEGIVKAEIPLELYEEDKTIIERIGKQVEDAFIGVQLSNFSKFSLPLSVIINWVF